MLVIDSILQRIKSTSPSGETKLVAFDGRGGSGKSSLASSLRALDPSLKIVQVDAFPCTPEEHPWHELGTQTYVNWERLRDEAILPLKRGEDAAFLRTPWWKGQKAGPVERVPWGGTVLVEGCYSLRRELRGLYDLTVWVECAVHEAVENAIRRDGENVRRIWEQVYAPNETSYINAHVPHKAADLIINSHHGELRFGPFEG